MTDINTPLISVITPVYNAEKFIQQCVESVLSQTYTNWELILVDDGSEDNSVEIINKFCDNKNIFFFQHPGGVNLGVSKSRALGIEKSGGDFIAFLDADDIFYPSKLKKQLLIFQQNPDVVLVHSRINLINEYDDYNNDFSIYKDDRKYNMRQQDEWLKKNTICNSSVMARAKSIKDLDIKFPQLFQFEDWLIWSLLSTLGSFYYHHDVLVGYRRHNNSFTVSLTKNKLASLYSMIEYLISFYISEKGGQNRSHVIFKLKETLVKLAETYADSTEAVDAINSFREDLNKDRNSAVHYVTEYNRILKEYTLLENNYKTLSHLQHSFLYRFLNFFKR